MDTQIESKEEKILTVPTLVSLDQMRGTGYRPTVICCCINEKKVLLLFKKEYHLWMLPQGGIDPGEEAETTVAREIEEEMGKKFAKDCSKKVEFLGEDQVEFLPEKQTGEELTTSDGKVFKVIGKHYYFYTLQVKTAELDLSETKFDESYWMESAAAGVLASKIYQPGRRRITLKAVNLLRDNKLID